jgi:hypothetical protein
MVSLALLRRTHELHQCGTKQMTSREEEAYEYIMIARTLSVEPRNLNRPKSHELYVG